MDGKQNKKSFTARDIPFIALFTAILFIQEEILIFIPNVQLTIFFIVLYSKKLGFTKTSLIIFIYVLLDNMIMGSFNLFYVPTMLIGWLFIPIIICGFCKKIESSWILGIIGALCAFIYSWIFIIPNYFVYRINPLAYFVSDIIFEIILAACGFLTILVLYKPCSKLFDKIRIAL